MSEDTTRPAIYARVSTGKQRTDRQVEALRQAVPGALEFTDTISGRRAKRPGLDALFGAIDAGDVGAVYCTSVDRLGRSLVDLARLLERFEAAGVPVVFHQQGIRTDTEGGRTMFGILAVLAEQERRAIVRRTREGRERTGRRGGRPRATITARAIEAMRTGGMTMDQIATETGFDRSTLYRRLAEKGGEDAEARNPEQPAEPGHDE